MKKIKLSKPVNLREETWQYLQENLKDKDPILKITKIDNFQFGHLLFKLNIINRPDLFRTKIKTNRS